MGELQIYRGLVQKLSPEDCDYQFSQMGERGRGAVEELRQQPALLVTAVADGRA